MPTTPPNRSEPSSDSRLPETLETFCSSIDDHPAQSTDGLRLDSGAGRILIVDDNPVVLKLVSKMAASLGYQPIVAVDAVDALFRLAENHYDLVITDYEMPLMDGFQLADQIKEKYFETRVIIMTGCNEKEVKDLLDGSGIVDGLLLKPFSVKALQEKIETAIQLRGWKWTP